MPSDKEYELEFERAMKLQYTEYLKYIEDTCRMLFKQAMVIELYNYYHPVQYHRTGQLVNSVKSKVQNDTLYLYVDTDELDYFSAVTGKDVSRFVPWFLTNNVKRPYGTGGHHDRFADTAGGQYHSYEKRKYLELGKQMIQDRFGVKVEIFNDLKNRKFP